MQNMVYIFNTEGASGCSYVATKRPNRYRRTKVNYMLIYKMICSGGIVFRLV